MRSRARGRSPGLPGRGLDSARHVTDLLERLQLVLQEADLLRELGVLLLDFRGILEALVGNTDVALGR